MTEEEMLNGVSMGDLPKRTIDEMKAANAQIPVSVEGQGSYNVPLRDVLTTAEFAANANTSAVMEAHMTEGDPHPQYALDADLSAHAGSTSNPHPQYALDADLSAHAGSTSNPHGVTKAQVGLGNVDDTTDADKPVSSAQQTAIDASMSGHVGTADPHPQYIRGTEIGVTVPSLENGAIPKRYLPGSYNEVQYYDALDDFPVVGESDVVYVARDTAMTYMWGGETYAALNASLALGETSQTAGRGDWTKAAFDHSQAQGNPHGLTKSDMELGNVDNTSDADKPVSTAAAIAISDKVSKTDTVAQRVISQLFVEAAGVPYTSTRRTSNTTGAFSGIHVVQETTGTSQEYFGAAFTAGVKDATASQAYDIGSLKFYRATTGDLDASANRESVASINISKNGALVSKCIVDQQGVLIPLTDGNYGGCIFFERVSGGYLSYLGKQPGNANPNQTYLVESGGVPRIIIDAANNEGRVYLRTRDSNGNTVQVYLDYDGSMVGNTPAPSDNNAKFATTAWTAKRASGTTLSLSSGATVTSAQFVNGITFLVPNGASVTLPPTVGAIGERCFFSMTGCSGGNITVNGVNKSGTQNYFGIIAEKNAVGWSVC